MSEPALAPTENIRERTRRIIVVMPEGLSHSEDALGHVVDGRFWKVPFSTYAVRFGPTSWCQSQ